MVNILRHASPLMDEQAMEAFRHQWQIYSKVVDNDYLSHHAVHACPVELEQEDFVSAMRARREPADIVWIGLALHHLQTPDKGALMREVRAAVGDGGRFLIYEPFCSEGESRPAYLDRFEQVNHSAWAALTSEEWAAMLAHVRAADFPEPASVWAQLGRDAG